MWFWENGKKKLEDLRNFSDAIKNNVRKGLVFLKDRNPDSPAYDPKDKPSKTTEITTDKIGAINPRSASNTQQDNLVEKSAKSRKNRDSKTFDM